MPATRDTIVITYVPADCGSLLPGKAKAPEAFRQAGIVQKLSERHQIIEQHALENPVTYKPEGMGLNGVSGEEANVGVCRAVSDAVSLGLTEAGPVVSEKKRGEGRRPFQLVLGGECLMVPGVMSAFWNHDEGACGRVGLVYIDADVDLMLPDVKGTGNIAAMTMTHATLREGCLESMEEFCRLGPGLGGKGGGRGVVDAGNCVLFGINMDAPGNTKDQLGYLFDEGFKVVSSKAVKRDPEGRAREVVKWLEERVDTVVVHLDVDAIDPGVFPLANFPSWTGVGFEEMMRAVTVLVAGGKVGGLTVGEVNPDHDGDGRMTRMLVDGIVEALRQS